MSGDCGVAIILIADTTGAVVVNHDTNDDDKEFWLGEVQKHGHDNPNFVQVADEPFTDDETEFAIGDEFCKIR